MRPPQFRRPSSRGFLSAGVAGMLLVSSLAMVVGTGFSFGETKLQDGVTWIFNRKDGEVARVNGSSGKVDLKIALPGSQGKDLEIVQRDDQVLVVDPKTGQVASLDVNGLEVAARTDFGTAEDLDVVLGDETAFVVDRKTGSVQRVDPVALDRIGEPIPAGESLSEGVADSAGRLWVARNATGEIIRVDPEGRGLREGVRRTLAGPGAQLEITVVDDGIVVTDAVSGKQWRLDGDGRDIGSIQVVRTEDPPPLAPDERYTPPVSEGPYVPVTDHGADPAVSLPPTNPGGGGPDREPIPLDTLPVDGLEDADLDPAVALGDRVYVPITSEGVLIVLDRTGRYLETIAVPGEGEFQLILDDGRLWVNDPDDPTALRIEADGTVTEVEKAAEAVPSTPPTTPEEPEEPEEPDTTTPPPDPGGNQPTLNTVPPAPTTTTTAPPTPTTAPITVPPTTTPTTQPPPTTQPAKPERPGAPTGLTATPNDALVDVRWGPADPAGAKVQRYDISWSGAGGCAPAGSANVGGDVLAFQLAPAVNGCAYSFSVTATNKVGTGPAAGPVSATPSADKPAAPAAPAARMDPASGTTILQWAQPDLKGKPSTGYVVTATSRNGEHTWAVDVAPGQTELQIPPSAGDAPNALTFGRTYLFTVAAKTVAVSDPSPPSAETLVYTGPSAIRLVDRQRTGPQQWRFTVQADWRGKVGTINGGGSGLGAAAGDPAGQVTFDVGIGWDTTKDLVFQAGLEGMNVQAQARQANPLPRFTGGVDPVWGPCSTNPDIPSDQVHENGYWRIQIDGGGEGAMQYVSEVQSTWAYAYGVNQPNPTQANEGFGTPPTRLEGSTILTNGRRHYPGYTFFVSFRFRVQGYDGWITSGRPGQNAPAC